MLNFYLKIKSIIFLVIFFFSSIAYAAAITEITKTSQDLTWPLIFNGIFPAAVIGFMGKRYLAKQDKFYEEYFKTKEDHIKRIGDIEAIHRLRGCDKPDRGDNVLRRRKEDN